MLLGEVIIYIELGSITTPQELGAITILLLLDLFLVLAQHLIVVVVQLFLVSIDFLLDLLRVSVALHIDLLQLLFFVELRLLILRAIQLKLLLRLICYHVVVITLVGLQIVEALNLLSEKLTKVHLVTLLLQCGLLHLKRMNLLIV